MEKEEATKQEGLAQLAAEQRFDEFEANFRRLVKQHLDNNERLQALQAECNEYRRIISALNKKEH